MQPTAKIKVLVVDDSMVLRRLISTALERDPLISVVGTARNGQDALRQLDLVRPDVVTLDVEMPEMDGIATVKEISRRQPRLPVIMCSSLTRKGALTTLDALAAGARDYVTKPENSSSPDATIDHFGNELLPRIKTLCGRSEVKPIAAGLARPAAPAIRPRSVSRNSPPKIVCIGVSTGGPNALEDVFRGFPESFPLPIVIVQHMPPVFTQLLAERLDKVSGLHFHEGAEGAEVLPGNAYIAPGGKHMTVQRENNRYVLRLNEQPPEHSCRPAADVLFRSVEATFGGAALAVILTGMGSDGALGSASLRALGAHVIAQDEPTSVVWGMPGAVVRLGAADEVLPLNNIQAAILQRASAGLAMAAK